MAPAQRHTCREDSRRFHYPGEEVRQRRDEAGQNHQGPSMLRKGIGVNAEAEGKPPGRVEAGQWCGWTCSLERPVCEEEGSACGRMRVKTLLQ